VWSKVKTLIRRHRSFAITTHVFPDGDAVGSELALAQILRRLGKKVLVVNEHPLPKIYRFLDPRRTAKVHAKKLAARIEKCDVVFAVDAGSPDRLGRVGITIQRAHLRSICIDHHKTNSSFADVNIVDTSAASTGELIYSLAKSLRVPITPHVAKCLFVAAATDTGWFRFPNTTPRTFRMAAELIENGVKPERMYQAVYETFRWQRMALMRQVLGTLCSECDGQIAYFYATEKMLREAKATQEDAEGFTNIPRVLRGVKLILFFREIGGKVRVSLRSRGGPPVEALARKYGGGGHARAAGITMKGPLRRAIRAVLGDARRLLEREGS